MEETPIFLKEDDVLSTPATALMYQCTFKVSEFMTIMQAKLLEERLFADGMDCELLSSGKAWTKGKVKMRLEFYPTDESELAEQPSLMPSTAEETDSESNDGENNAETIEVEPEFIDSSDSTSNSNNFPPFKYPDNDPQSLGMWS
ncbi:MAG: KGK domain-containing protein [Microcoleus sp.]